MLKNRLLEQFRSFYIKNYPDDMEVQIEYFAVFGGLDVHIDCKKPLKELIQKLILEHFDSINDQITELTLDNHESLRLLRAVAIGDRKIFSAFNRAGLNNANGGSSLNFLEQKGVLQIEFSREEKAKKANPKSRLRREVARHRVSHKILFIHPFLRFWFYFVASHVKEIKNGDFATFFKDFELNQNSYTSLVFEELSQIVLNYHLRDSQILSSGSYWDANIEIDILTLTEDGKIYAAECKWTNHIVSKHEWQKLLEKCQKLSIVPQTCIFFSKRGFSKELSSYEGKSLLLFTASDFILLVKSAKENGAKSDLNELKIYLAP